MRIGDPDEVINLYDREFWKIFGQDIKQRNYQPTTAFNQNTKSQLIENDNYKTDHQPIQGMNTSVVF